MNVSMEIKLYDEQKTHIENVLNHFNEHKIYVDTSPMGSGKTVMSIYIAKKLGLKLYVICPPNVTEKWEGECKKYSCCLYGIINYEKVALMSSNILHRIERKKFLISDKFISAVKEGIYLVVDEVHLIKNLDTLRFISCNTLIRHIHETNSRSRIALLSATPGDKKEHIESFLNLLNFFHGPLQYVLKRKPNEFREFKKFCHQLSPEKTKTVEEHFRIMNDKNAMIAVFMLFRFVLKERFFLRSKAHSITSIASGNLTNQHINEPDIKHGCYKISKENEKNIQEIIDEIIAKENYTNKVLLTKWEENLIEKIAEISLNDLKKGYKVIVVLFYKKNVRKMQELLKDLKGFQILNGDTEIKKRNEIVRKFQEGNHDVPLLIINPRVAGVGIDLDDRIGNFPRSMFIAPNYYFLDISQTIGRIWRPPHTKSVPKVRFVYSIEHFDKTIELYEKFVKKTKDAKEFLDRKAIDSNNLKLIGDYPLVIED
ncbi:MAG: helicase-related protein [Candidatus Aenigmatarchaeota archaeon]